MSPHQTPAPAVPAPRAPRPDLHPGARPDHASAWAELVAANARWAQGRSDAAETRSPTRRATLLTSQSPAVAVLGCSDSRVPVEVVLDQGLGELFVVRTAGHALDDTVVGSLEYAVGQLGVRLVLVLGHEGCGALAAAGAVLDGAALPGGCLGTVVDALRPAVAQARRDGARTGVEVSRHHAGATAEQLRQRSALVRTAHESGAVEVLAATYSLVSGVVTAVTAPAPARGAASVRR